MLVELLKKKALNLNDVFEGNAAASQASSNESSKYLSKSLLVHLNDGYICSSWPPLEPQEP